MPPSSRITGKSRNELLHFWLLLGGKNTLKFFTTFLEPIENPFEIQVNSPSLLGFVSSLSGFGLVSPRLLWGVFFFNEETKFGTKNQSGFALPRAYCTSGRLLLPPKNADGWTHPNNQPCWEGEIAHLSKTQFLQLPGQLRNRNS